MEVRMVDQRSPEQSEETRKYQKGIRDTQKGSCQNGSRVGVLGYHRGGVQGLAHRGTGKEILTEITPATIYINTSLGAEAPVQQILVARIGRRTEEFLVGVVKEDGRNSRKERHR
jgi:hypothetical protein